jgi:hypothetical protein
MEALIGALIGGGFVVAGIVIQQLVTTYGEKKKRKREQKARLSGLMTKYIDIGLFLNIEMLEHTYNWCFYQIYLRAEDRDNLPVSECFEISKIKQSNTVEIRFKLIDITQEIDATINELGMLYNKDLSFLVKKIHYYERNEQDVIESIISPVKKHFDQRKCTDAYEAGIRKMIKNSEAHETFLDEIEKEINKL